MAMEAQVKHMREGGAKRLGVAIHFSECKPSLRSSVHDGLPVASDLVGTDISCAGDG